jgi:hypothetical protein
MTIDKNIFCIWSGDNEMSDSRKRCLDSIQKNSNVKIELITPKNLSSWIIEPIHESYEYLSLTHKADYLRAYLMKHYGTGYADIKPMHFDWNPYFDFLENSQFEFIGYAENHPNHVASTKHEIQSSFYNLCGCCHFIFKKGSSFANKWFDKVHSILDIKKEDLKKYPGTYHARAVFGGVHQPENNNFSDSKYPLFWNEILGNIIHELMYYNQNLYTTGMPHVNLSHSYR